MLFSFCAEILSREDYKISFWWFFMNIHVRRVATFTDIRSRRVEQLHEHSREKRLILLAIHCRKLEGGLPLWTQQEVGIYSWTSMAVEWPIFMNIYGRKAAYLNEHQWRNSGSTSRTIMAGRWLVFKNLYGRMMAYLHKHPWQEGSLSSRISVAEERLFFINIHAGEWLIFMNIRSRISAVGWLSVV